MRVRALFAGLAIAAAAIFVAGRANAESSVKIGALYPLSGQVAKSGEDTMNAIKLAVDLINKKYPGVDLPFAKTEGLPNLKGAKIELIVADHQGSPEILSLIHISEPTRLGMISY